MADPAKTEKATPRRRQEARERGQVVRSTEVNSIVILFTAVLVLRYAGLYMMDAIGRLTVFTYQNLNVSFGMDSVNYYVLFYMWQIFLITSPVLGVILLVGLLTNYLQVGVLFSLKPLIPKLSNINPATGFKRLFSRRSFAEFVKSLLKLAVIGWLGYRGIKSAIPQLVTAMDMPGTEALKFIGALSWKILIWIIFALLVVSVLDYFYQKYEYEESLKMTKQEIRDEYKQSEGDPMIKARIRQLQREMARRRMFEAVPKADVVITNPTHVAVALQYNETLSAPLVVAKGERVIAERIKEMARKNRIPIVENPPLARALLKSCPVGAPIPADLFEAVAEVLAFVYRMNKRGVA